MAPNTSFGITNNVPFCFYAIAVFDHLPDKGLLKELQNNEIHLISWIEKSSYVVRISSMDTYNTLIGKDIQGDLPFLGIRSIAEVPLTLKLSGDLFLFVSNPLILNSVGVNDITISVFEKQYVTPLKAYLSENGISLIGNISSTGVSSTVSVSKVTAKQIIEIASLNYVNNIIAYSNTYKETALRNQIGAQIFSINYDTLNGYTGRNNYSGTVETLSNTDPEMLRKFRNRMVTNTILGTGNMTAHAETTSEVMAGGNNFDELDRGMAPATQMIQAYWDAAQTMINYNLGYHPLSVNASVFTFPSGQGESSVYNRNLANWDAAIRSVPDLMFAAAAGNTGSDSGINGFPKGWNNLVYGTGGKNSFTVSNIKIPGETSFGCNGPTNDGRIAPLVNTEGNGGTSFASPSIAGLFSDLFEAYTDVYHAAARSDVVKSVILNTAQDIYKKGPDFKSGYGEANPYEALKAIKEHTFYTGTVEQGEDYTPIIQTLNLPSGLRQFRIMLYWHDYPGTPNASKVLVNDLDLKVVTPAGDTILPWVLSSNPLHITELATRGIDTLNNQEQVTIDDPQAGLYKFLVYGKEVPMGPQDYVLTYMLNPYHIKITTPDGYRLPPVNYSDDYFGFTWDYALNTDNPNDSIQVFLQRQSGDPFVQIGSVGTRALEADVSATKSAPVGFYLRYAVPSDFPITSTARIVVKQKNQPYADTSGFYQYSPMVDGLKVIASCPERVTVQWQKMDSLKAGGKYIIYRLGETLMEPIDSVPYTQDSLTLSAYNLLSAGHTFSNDEWFAVAVRHANGVLSYRSYPVTQRMTNPLLSGVPQTKYTLCKADTAVLNVDPNYIKDSIRWFKNGDAVADGTSDTIRITMNEFGKYTYKSYFQGCAFISDTFYVNKNPNDISLSDTVFTKQEKWRCYVYNGNYDDNDVYGYFDMDSTDLSLYTTDYFSTANANPWSVPNYVGCPLINKDFTLVMKRNGFPTGNYVIKAHQIYNVAKLWIDGQLIYQSSNNMNTIEDIWSGQLTLDSKVRIVLKSVNVSGASFDFIRDAADINLALHKPAIQSTTWNSSQSAANATDGNYSDVSSTDGTDNFPYMNIDLGDSARIDRFYLWNRTPSTAAYRLHNYYIFVSDQPFENVNTDPSVIAARPGVYSVYRTDTAVRPTIIGAGFKGRYIRIQINSAEGLNMSELEAFGQWLNPDSLQLKNLAYHKATTQSSTYKTNYASNAVDGIIDGSFADGSIAHTGVDLEQQVNPWWMVDLGSICHIMTINIYNRTDAQFIPRFKDYNILVSSEPLNMSTDSTLYASATIFNNTTVAGRPSTLNIDMDGRYIALQFPGSRPADGPDKIINLAEFQVFGYEKNMDSSSTLVIKWGPFSAMAEKNDVILKWSTIAEISNKSFDIERLDMNQQFKKIGSLAANENPSSYQFTDPSPKVGTNTYRLKSYDLDGTFSYSPIRSVRFKSLSSINDFAIRPNPVNDLLKIVKSESISGPLVFSIIDVMGRIISKWNVMSPGKIIEKNVSHLVKGIYFLQIETSKGAGSFLKFIKQ